MNHFEKYQYLLKKILFACFVFIVGWVFPFLSFADSLTSVASDQGKVIRSIEFRGYSKIEEAAMRLKLDLLQDVKNGRNISQVGNPLDTKTVREEIQALWAMNEFDDVRAEVKDAPSDQVDLIFVVVEKPTIRKVLFVGNQEIKTEDIEKELLLKTGTVYRPELIREKSEKIRQMYADQGFALAEVVSEVLQLAQNTVEVTFRVTEHAKAQVRQIRFIGNKKFSDEELKEALIGVHEDYRWSDLFDFFRGRNVPSGTYRQDYLEGSIQQLSAFYAEHGYLSFRAGKPQISTSADKRFIYITLPVTEGAQYKVEKIDIQMDPIGFSAISKKELLAEVKSKSGDLFHRTQVFDTVQKLERKFKDIGYARVKVEPLFSDQTLHEERQAVDLVFSIKPGPVIRIGRIEIRGNDKTRDKVIRRELYVAEGDIYNQTLLDKSRFKLLQLDFFERVDFVLNTNSKFEDRIDLVISISSEKSTGQFNVGVGFSTVQYLTLQGMISQRNFLGWGSRLNLSASVAPIGTFLSQLFTLSYFDPRFLDSRVGVGISLNRNFQTFPNATYLKEIWGGSISFGYLLTDFLSINASYHLDFVNVRPYGPDLQDTWLASRLYRKGFTSMIRLGLQYSDVDSVILPSKGFGDHTLGMMHSLNLEISDQWIGSQVNYLKLDGALRFYRPMFDFLTFRFLLAGGIVLSRSKDGVPIPERFFNAQGFLFENRGFYPNAMGPRVSVGGGDPYGAPQYTSIGANYFVRASAELEFPLFPKKYTALNALGFKGAVFLDVGNGYNLESNSDSSLDYCAKSTESPGVVSACAKYPTFQNLRYSVGVGLLWNFSPLGPLRFEFGFPLNPLLGAEPFRDKLFNFTFRIGSSF